MGFQTGGPNVTANPAQVAPHGTHYDAAGNLVDDATGQIITTAQQIAANRTGNPEWQREATTGGIGNDVADFLVAKNPIAGVANAGVDLAQGNPTGALGDLATGGTFGVVTPPQNSVAGQQTQSPGVGIDVPGVTPPVTAGQAAGAVGDAVGAVGDAVGDVFGGPSAPGAPADAAAQEEFRRQQLAYAQQLQAVIDGTAGPSAAEIQGRNAADRAMAQQFAAAQGATGQNAGLAYRQALQNASGLQSQAIADAAARRASEVSDARQQYANLLNSGRTGDLQKYQTDVGAANTRYAADKDYQGKKIAAATGVGSAVIPALVSDERKKHAVGDGEADVCEMFDKLAAKSFRYNDPGEPGAAPGRRTGIMAQDLERSPAGRALVRDTPTGKVIDSPQAIGAMFAMLASLNKRTRAIEAR